MKKLRVIIGCEESGVVRRAFRALGHDAWSCDLLPPADGADEHYQRPVTEVLGLGWDLGIFHPPCTRLTNSGVLRLYRGSKKAGGIDPAKWAEMEQGRALFMACWESPIPAVCVENPIPHHHARLPEYQQTIQPYEFGHPESKRTCLWLRGLPQLLLTKVLPLPACGHWSNQTKSGQNKLSPSPRRAAIRARTYEGIAAAMAEQWSKYLAENQSLALARWRERAADSRD